MLPDMHAVAECGARRTWLPRLGQAARQAARAWAEPLHLRKVRRPRVPTSSGFTPSLGSMGTSNDLTCDDAGSRGQNSGAA